jgi:sugar phosphate permease
MDIVSVSPIQDRWRLSPEWLLIVALWVCYALNHADRQVLYTLFPAVQRQFGYSDAVLGLTGALFLWVYGICSPFAGVLADRISLSGLVAERFRWRLSFLLLGAVGLLFALSLRRLLRSLPKEYDLGAGAETVRFSDFQTLCRILSLITVALLMSALTFGIFLVYTWLPTMFYDKFHLGLGRSGFEASFYPQIGSLCGVIIGGWAGDLRFRSEQHARVRQGSGCRVGILRIGMPGESVSGCLRRSSFHVAGHNSRRHESPCGGRIRFCALPWWGLPEAHWCRPVDLHRRLVHCLRNFGFGGIYLVAS